MIWRFAFQESGIRPHYSEALPLACAPANREANQMRCGRSSPRDHTDPSIAIPAHSQPRARTRHEWNFPHRFHMSEVWCYRDVIHGGRFSGKVGVRTRLRQSPHDSPQGTVTVGSFGTIHSTETVRDHVNYFVCSWCLLQQALTRSSCAAIPNGSDRRHFRATRD